MSEATPKKVEEAEATEKKAAKKTTAAKTTAAKAAKSTKAKKTTKTAAKKKTTKKAAATAAGAKKKTAKKAAAKKTEKSLRVRQVRSGIRHPWRMRRTLRALGLKHHQDEVVVPDNPSVKGMLQRVHHLVSVTPEDTNG